MPTGQPTIINKFGKIIGWNNITLNTLGRDVEAISEIAYSDEQDMDNEYGAGGYPIGQSEGNYKAKGSINLYAEELIAIQQTLPAGTRIQQIPPFDIIVQYEYKGFNVKDILRNCKFKNNGREVKQADGKIVTKIELLVSHIDWNA